MDFLKRLKPLLGCGLLLATTGFVFAQSEGEPEGGLGDLTKIEWIIDTSGGYVVIALDIQSSRSEPINVSYKLNVSKHGITGNVSRTSQGGVEVIKPGQAIRTGVVKINCNKGDEVSLSYDISAKGYEDKLHGEKSIAF